MKPILTTEAFADWCEKQPADKHYEYVDSDVCACSQYAQFIGLLQQDGMPAWRKAFYDGSPFWIEADDLAAGLPFTFGALAARARSAS